MQSPHKKQGYVFEGWSWLKFSKLGLALGMVLTFYRSMIKRLKLKVRKFKKLISFTGEAIQG